MEPQQPKHASDIILLGGYAREIEDFNIHDVDTYIFSPWTKVVPIYYQVLLKLLMQSILHIMP